MSKTINTHVYALQGTSESGASYGATLTEGTAVARLNAIKTRQNGEEGYRVTRAIDLTVMDAEGLPSTTTASISIFLPVACPVAGIDAVFGEAKAWMNEATFLAQVKNRSVE